jgi:lipopolysaccharide transport system ATP-binding protein
MQRQPVTSSHEPLIELNDVSKQLAMHRDTGRSFQDMFISLFKRRHDERPYFWPVQHVSFSVMPGESLGIIGPNGSGKSTLLKLITGIFEPTTGKINTRGRISSLLELGAGFHPELTGRENIYLNGSIFGISRKEMNHLQDSIIDFAELGDFIDVPVKHYSSGMYVRLGFAVAIHTKPDVLLVDEVLAVGDAAFQHRCMDRVQRFRQRGGTLLLVSHDLATIQSICHRALWLEGGQVMALGKPTDVVMNYLNRVARTEDAAAGSKPAARPESDRRWGTGRIQITRVQICDGDGNETSVFTTGCPLEIRLHYSAEEPVNDPIFGIGVHHQNGTHVSGPNSGLAGLTIPTIQGQGQVAFRIPSLSLLEGAYLVSVASHNREDTEMYDYHDRVYPFRVYPGTSREGYGLVTLNGDWEFPQVSTRIDLRDLGRIPERSGKA